MQQDRTSEETAKSIIVQREGYRIPPQAMAALISTNAKHFTVISDGEWNALMLDVHSAYIAIWNIPTSLHIVRNNEANIIKQIHSIEFPHLQIINLRANQIETIQILCRMKWPALIGLVLEDNNLTTFCSIRKINTPQLKNLSIQKNKHDKDLDIGLVEMFAPHVTGISTFSWVSSRNSCILGWICKIEAFPDTFNSLWINEGSRLRLSQSKKTIESRYPLAEIN